MARIDIALDNQRVLRALQGMLEVMEEPRPIFQEIGEYLIESTRRRFVTSTGPDGQPWAPNSPVTLARKKGKRPLIGETKRLSQEILLALGAHDVEVGYNLVYAAMQQFGAKMGQFGRYSQLSRRKQYDPSDFRYHAGSKKGFPIPWGNIPARPILGLSVDDETAIVDIVKEALAAPLQ